MAKYTSGIEPLERAIAEGRSTITTEDAVGLRGGKKKKKESVLRRLARLMQMAALGGRYKSEFQRQKEQEQFQTTRTKAISGGLREGGLTEEEIRRMR
jgi:hypothetical protein